MTISGEQPVPDPAAPTDDAAAVTRETPSAFCLNVIHTTEYEAMDSCLSRRTPCTP